MVSSITKGNIDENILRMIKNALENNISFIDLSKLTEHSKVIEEITIIYTAKNSSAISWINESCPWSEKNNLVFLQIYMVK